MTRMKPTVTTRPRHGEEVERLDHPAFATIAASRVQSTGRALFGSDFIHRHYVTVRIGKADMERSLATDWIHGSTTDDYIEVALSEAQWAAFVSSMNVGTGVPCTVMYLGGQGPVPEIDLEVNRRAQLNDEIAAEMREQLTRLSEIRDAAPTKKMREAIDLVIRRLADSGPWLLKRYDEHAEETVERAKIEVNAYITAAIQRAGVAALTGGEGPLALNPGQSGETQEEPT